jgi:Na+(H+)/acetate symporter ActP
MKELLKKTFNTSVLAVVGVVFGIGLIFQFIVFPGLTASDTVLNILSLLIGIFSLLFAFHFVQWKKLFDFLSDEKEPIKPGETEFDYIPKEEIVKKKRTYKKKVEPHVVHPKVKTKKK